MVHYIRAIGWNLNTVHQTGSNFGTNQQHDNPLFCEIGSGTMVSDGLSMINMHKSATAFRLEHTKVGNRTFLGNNIHFPPDSRIGANCRIHVDVVIGTRPGPDDLVPTLGDNCYIGPGAKIFGDIIIGPNTAIGANSVVNASFPEGFMTIAGAPARKVSDTPSTEFIIATRSHKKTLG